MVANVSLINEDKDIAPKRNNFQKVIHMIEYFIKPY